MDIERLRSYTKWHHFVNEIEYDAPADPWRLLRVDPTTVEHYTNEIRLNWGLGRIEGGDWDRKKNCNPLSETTTYKGLKQRFEDGYDWEETAHYQQAKEQFENGSTVRGYDSLDEFRNVRCEYIDELFHSIVENGYRPNAEATHEKATQENVFEDAYVHHLEPLVVISRSGDIYLAEGYHRFIIALIRDLDEIPVYVLCRHEQWQRIRDRVHDTPVSDLPFELEEYSDHPDLQNDLL